MTKMLVPVLLLLVAVAWAQGPGQQTPSDMPWEAPHAKFYHYNFQTHYRYDGIATKVNGGPTFSTTPPDVAVNFYKTFVVDGFMGNGTDDQVLAFRDKAVTFYQNRYGLIFPEPLPADPTAMLVLKYPNGTNSDSVVVPTLLDRSFQARTLAFVAGKKSITFPAAEQYDCGWYLFVGPSGYPAGGSFGKPLPPGGSGSYGVQAIQNVCPKISKYCKGCCKGSKGQLLMNVMTQEILTPAPDLGWQVGMNSSLDTLGPAFKVPIEISITHKEFGQGLCSGLFYAVPYNVTSYSLLHNAGCFFPPPPGYPTLPMVIAF